MKVYIARHGEVLHNASKRFDNTDEALTEKGIMQAHKLRDDIEKLKFDVIISSPLKRTKETTNIINVNNYKVIYDDRLKERDCGSLSGLSFNKEEKAEYWNYFTNKRYGTEEDIKIFFDRIYKFLDELKEMKYDNVLIIAHSGVAKAFNAYFNGIGDGKFSNKSLKNCEIIEYEF